MKRVPAVGIDVGTSKICAVVADAAAGGIRVLGAGTGPAAGIKKGVVVHMEEATQSLREAIREAAATSGVSIASATACVSGGHLQVIESSGAIGVRGREITMEDRDRVVDVAGTVYIPLDREVLHTLPAEFMIDGVGGIREPVGMTGVRLETKVHIVTAAAAPLRNLARCCEAAGVKVEEFVSHAAASGRAVLTRDERNDGVVLVDMGGGTTDIAFFQDGQLRNVSVLCVGGNHITSDIAIGLGLSQAEAEQLKRTRGAAFVAKDEADAEIVLGGDEERRISRRGLRLIMQARCEEMIEMIISGLQGFPGAAESAGGIVLTGGASLLPGLRKLMALRTGRPVRNGCAAVLSGCRMTEGPQYSAAVGLVAGRVLADQETDESGWTEGFRDRARDYWISMTKFAELLQSYRKEGGSVCLRSKR